METSSSKNTKQNQTKYLYSDKGKQIVDTTMLISKNSSSNTPPFLLTFDIFNMDAHNWMVDFGAFSNAMPLIICQKINAQPK